MNKNKLEPVFAALEFLKKENNHNKRISAKIDLVTNLLKQDGLGIDKAIYELDALINQELSSYNRTQILSIISILESL